MAKKTKGAATTEDGAGAMATGAGIRLSAHPRARRHIGMAKGWGGLIAFLLVLKLSRGAALPWSDAFGRAVLGGVIGYVVAWAIAQTIWRHIALAELEQLRRKLVAMAEAQNAGRKAASAEADAAAAAPAAPAPVPQR
jgi:hypothetical protein